MELNEWAFVGVFLALAWIFPAAPIILNKIISPKRPNPIKRDIYECGVETVGDAWGQIKVQYYLYAIIFLVFDIELVFLFPWAVTYGAIGLSAYIAGAIFILLLLEGLIYAWRKGALEWV